MESRVKGILNRVFFCPRNKNGTGRAATDRGTWVHGGIVAEHAGEDLELVHEAGGPSARARPLGARPLVVAPPTALELEQPAASAGAGAAVEVVRRRAPVEAHCKLTRVPLRTHVRLRHRSSAGQ